MQAARRTSWIPAAAALLLCASRLWAQEHQPPKVRQPPAYLTDDDARSSSLYARVLPTVVTILTSEHVYTNEGQEVREGLGSGVVISKECHVLTAAHVVAGADLILVKTSDDQLREAELLFSEAGADIILAFDTQATCHTQCLVHARKQFAGLDRIRVTHLREGKRFETEVDVSAARQNFLSSGEHDDVDDD